MFGLGPTELVIIAIIVLLLFGAKRLPEIGKGIGGAIREFKKVRKEIAEEGNADKGSGTTPAEGEKGSTALEEKVAEKVMEQVPGVKKAVEAKRKVEKVKEFLNS
ncbi:MAG: twin-arginine translocase TatA/TatE family subunit [Deltaproteobacteria bacterium]|nr:twin-arginine translocase TatA/TatE family subunit [Deltaproteobacteria bacterium]MBW2016851.1 twin-arginine translocase TatA/TatE family subunit [Deltaproteobacteria bacterium]MBW2130445.1 twin-arginine translocase TatA/TatE family subunit [Deltaproteobacteria bacterium]MBW2304533.1 twin-arginine translocase TatA/TatE family subunit [Deltaproteobacteria bacterium]